jgi:ABC-type multidrug transport system permease subunit
MAKGAKKRSGLLKFLIEYFIVYKEKKDAYIRPFILICAFCLISFMFFFMASIIKLAVISVILYIIGVIFALIALGYVFLFLKQIIWTIAYFIKNKK